MNIESIVLIMQTRIIHDYNDSIYKGRIKRAKIQVATNFSFETIDTLGLVAVIIYSTRALAYGMISQATAMSLVMYVFRVIEPISRIMDFVDTISFYLLETSSKCS